MFTKTKNICKARRIHKTILSAESLPKSAGVLQLRSYRFEDFESRLFVTKKCGFWNLFCDSTVCAYFAKS
jgi:hypothetical protein